MSAPTVTVVVVTFNSAHLVASLLDGLRQGLDPLPWRLVVADNASADGTVEVLRRLAPEATVVEMGRNAGYAAGINAAVRAAAASDGVPGPTLVLNPDVVLAPGCVPELLRVLEEEGAGVVVPRLLDGNGDLVLSMRREPTVLRAAADALIGANRAGRFPLLGETVTDLAAYERLTPVDWAEGSTQLVSAACLAACSPWDEGFFLYSEETDFCLRAADAGWRTCLEPSAVVEHVGGASGRDTRTHAMMILNRVRLYSRRHVHAKAWLYYALNVLSEVSWVLRGHAEAKASVAALLVPRLRPIELACSDRVLPR